MSGVLELPNVTITRIVKSALPDSIQVGKAAKQAMAQAAALFILYVTDTANSYCKRSKRATINSEDIQKALAELEFDELLEPLQEFLEAYQAEAAPKRRKKKDDGVEDKSPKKSSKKASTPTSKRKSPSAADTGDAAAAAAASAPAAAADDSSSAAAAAVAVDDDPIDEAE